MNIMFGLLASAMIQVISSKNATCPALTFPPCTEVYGSVICLDDQNFCRGQLEYTLQHCPLFPNLDSCTDERVTIINGDHWKFTRDKHSGTYILTVVLGTAVTHAYFSGSI